MDIRMKIQMTNQIQRDMKEAVKIQKQCQLIMAKKLRKSQRFKIYEVSFPFRRILYYQNCVIYCIFRICE